MKAGIKVVSSMDAVITYTCSTVARPCCGSECMAWSAVGGFKCLECEAVNTIPMECCGTSMKVNKDGSCGMVPL